MARKKLFSALRSSTSQRLISDGTHQHRASRACARRDGWRRNRAAACCPRSTPREDPRGRGAPDDGDRPGRPRPGGRGGGRFAVGGRPRTARCCRPGSPPSRSAIGEPGFEFGEPCSRAAHALSELAKVISAVPRWSGSGRGPCLWRWWALAWRHARHLGQLVLQTQPGHSRPRTAGESAQ